MNLARREWALIGAAALLLTLAYPPFELWVPPFVCLVPATLLILGGSASADSWRRHLHQGFWYGLVTSGALLYWLVGALWRYAPGAVVLYVLACLAFAGATAALFVAVGRAVAVSPGRIVVALPAGVVALEWVSAQLGPIAFPWHRIALTVAAHPVLVQGADLLGSGGLGYAIATVNACLGLAWWTRSRPRTALLQLETAAAVLVCMWLYGLHRISTVRLDAGVAASVVQPNVGWDEKWLPAEADAIAEAAVRLASAAIEETGAALVALPETAFPGRLSDHPRWVTDASRLSIATGTTLLVGGMDAVVERSGPDRSANALFSFDPVIGAGTTVVHRKRQFVPVVERSILSGAAWRWAAAPPTVARGPIGHYGALICFELTFEGLARDLRRRGARVLVTVSNDAWLGRSAGPHQHFAHAVLRAVENRVAVVRAANTGVSGIVDPLGRVVARTRPHTEGYVGGLVRQARVSPPAVRLGSAAGPLALALLVGQLLGGLAKSWLVGRSLTHETLVFGPRKGTTWISQVMGARSQGGSGMGMVSWGGVGRESDRHARRRTSGSEVEPGEVRSFTRGHHGLGGSEPLDAARGHHGTAEAVRAAARSPRP